MSKIVKSQMYVTKVSSSCNHFKKVYFNFIDFRRRMSYRCYYILINIPTSVQILFFENLSLSDSLTAQLFHAHYCIAFTPSTHHIRLQRDSVC